MVEDVRVLLVDDDDDDSFLIRSFLEEIDSFHCMFERAGTYDAGVEMVRQQCHDVYLFDYRLGAENGLDLVNLATSIGCQAPVIMLTGQSADGLDIEALRAGASDYLTKGQFDAQLLGRSIRYSMERKRVERALRVTEERYRDLLENANDTVFTHDWEGVLTSVNGAMERISGYSRLELIGRNLSDLLTRESIGDFEQMKLRKISGERSGSYEICLRTKQGRVVVIEVNDRLIGDGHKSVEFQAIGRDVTDRKMSEEKLKDSAHEIEERNSELAAALAALRGKWSERRVLAEFGQLEDPVPPCDT